MREKSRARIRRLLKSLGFTCLFLSLTIGITILVVITIWVVLPFLVGLLPEVSFFTLMVALLFLAVWRVAYMILTEEEDGGMFKDW